MISSVTQAFCHDCSRVRLSTEGKLYTCLFATSGHDLRALLRGGRSDEEISDCDRPAVARAQRPLFGTAHASTRPAWDAAAKKSRNVVHRRLTP